jgi:hypothetical protein
LFRPDGHAIRRFTPSSGLDLSEATQVHESKRIIHVGVQFSRHEQSGPEVRSESGIIAENDIFDSCGERGYVALL